MSDLLEAAEEAARIGGEVLLRWAGKIAAREKAPADLVTEADLESQEKIREYLLGRFPDHDFLGEEGAPAEIRNSEFRWVVDPLDGTLNYVHGLANYSVSIALQQENRMIVGVVCDPLTGECFRAEENQGAFLNNQPLKTSGVDQLSQALVAASFAPQIQPGLPEVDAFLRVLFACQGLRRMGSAALNLCYVASGRMDGYWATSTHLWDVAAGMLILREAGGIFTAFDGQPFDLEKPNFIASANAPLHGQLLQTLAGDDKS
ncbi:MAG: inositol monophosphatase [Planctomycetales bacterium]